jgi:hypothetical protein
MSNVGPMIFEALMAHYEALRREAILQLQIYFTSSIGIGNHSTHLDECKKWTEKLTSAEECLATLNKLRASPEKSEEND